jgi:hypothetical protein
MPRLLRCTICMTINKLPEYDGDPTQDRALIAACELHRHEDAPEEARAHAGLLFRVDQETYDKMERITELNKDRFADQQWAYDIRDQFKADAYTCWLQHRMPNKDHGCPDFWSETKILPNPVAKGQPDSKRQYLCMYCPFTHGVVVPELRKRKGMYDSK